MSGQVKMERAVVLRALQGDVPESERGGCATPGVDMEDRDDGATSTRADPGFRHSQAERAMPPDGAIDANADLLVRDGDVAEFIGHELRNPLTAITTLAELVLDRSGDDLDEESRRDLRRIVGAADQMSSSIDGVTSVLRPKGCHGEREFDATDLVRKVVHDIAAEAHGPSFQVRVGLLPTLRGDPAQLRLVFHNLVGNAVKYRNPAVPLHITVTAVRGARHILFSVTDNGLGIPEEERRRVFELGYRATGGGADGSGVGLALCRRIVRRNGGAIWVDCAVRTGTRICFTIPSSVLTSGQGGRFPNGDRAAGRGGTSDRGRGS
jgi:signal transduction histidine kinase